MDRRNFLRTAMGSTGAATLASGLPSALGAPASSATTSRGGRVLTGIQVLARDGYQLVRGERVGLISNPTGIVPDLRHEIDVIVASGQVDLVAAFGPEHGFRGSSQAGGSEACISA